MRSLQLQLPDPIGVCSCYLKSVFFQGGLRLISLELGRQLVHGASFLLPICDVKFGLMKFASCVFVVGFGVGFDCLKKGGFALSFLLLSVFV